MPSSEIAFHVAVTELPETGVCVVQLKDAFLNYASSDDLKTNLKGLCRERMAAGVRGFAIDLSRVTVMDSCGLSVLISVKKLVEGEGARVSLYGLSPMIQRLFEITKLESIFDIFPDEAAATGALA